MKGLRSTVECECMKLGGERLKLSGNTLLRKNREILVELGDLGFKIRR